MLVGSRADGSLRSAGTAVVWCADDVGVTSAYHCFDM
jgi:hypothetical protein